MSKNQKNNPWCVKVVFDDFCAHFIALSDSEIAKDIKESIKCLIKKTSDGESFGAKMVRDAVERIETNRLVKGVHGVEGGRPRKDVQADKAPNTLPAANGLLTYGRFENVKLSQQQFSELAVKIGNVNELNSMIDSLSCKVEDGSAKSDNHYATLIHWIDYRREHPSPSKNTNATVSAVANAQDETSRRLAMIRKLGR